MTAVQDPGIPRCRSWKDACGDTDEDIALTTREVGRLIANHHILPGEMRSVRWIYLWCRFQCR